MASPCCRNCGKRMDRGFLIDAGDYSIPSAGAWHGGEPKKSMWWGVKVSKEQRREIVSWRCPGCGLLENYAI